MEDYAFGFQGWRDMEKSMVEKKYVIPEGMLKAACGPSILSWSTDADGIKRMLESAFDWLSKNPIVPTNEQIGAMTNKGSSLHWGWDSHWREHTRDWLVEWQRRMFLAPKPEVPEEVKDLLWAKGEPFQEQHDKDILEAFNRGRKWFETT